MLVIIGSIRIPPANLTKARAVMARMIEASRAEAGCLAYWYAEDVLEPGLIRVAEAWNDQAALDRHFASPHIAAWRATWPELGITDRQLVEYSGLESGRPLDSLRP